MSDNKLLEVSNLVVHYETDEEVVEAVNNVSFTVNKGEVLGLVGETGAGKTTIALSIIGLLPMPPANIISGSIKFDGEELLMVSDGETVVGKAKLKGDKLTITSEAEYWNTEVEETIVFERD